MTTSNAANKGKRPLFPNPKVPSTRLHGAMERYKIKLRNAGYRLVYEVRHQQLIVLVVAVGKRERNEVYRVASKR